MNEADFENIVDQLCTRLQDIKDQESTTEVGMHLDSLEQNEAARRYYAAFPALKKGKESPHQYYLPPPAWCRKTVQNNNKVKMQSDLSLSKDFSPKNKKLSSGKERRNSYHGQRKSKKRCHNNYSRSFDSKENLPEWVTHEGVWDMETQDPIKEFIKAIAVDEGYGTCENTVTDDIREIAELNFRMNENKVPDWDDSLDLDSEWVITEDLKPRIKTPMEEELYAKFEAKFDRSIEALWSKDQANTPDDEYQDLPIDFQDLLSSPSDNQFFDPSAEKFSLISLTESIWSNDARDRLSAGAGVHRGESPTASVQVLHDCFKPLNLDDTLIAEPKSPEPFSLYSYDGIYEAVPSVADVMRSLTAINHSREHSSFTEVIPRRSARAPPRPASPHPLPAAALAAVPAADDEDPLYAERTHFKPIRKEAATGSAAAVRYADGDTFDIRSSLPPLPYTSRAGYLYLQEDPQPYLEYRTRSIDYSRLNLSAALRKANDFDDREFRLKFPVKQTDAGVQTEEVRAHSCSVGAKKMRGEGAGEGAGPGGDERDWEELMSDISAYQQVTEVPEGEVVVAVADRKRRHSAALRCRPAHPPHTSHPPHCSHPHAPFLHCIGSDRPLTR